MKGHLSMLKSHYGPLIKSNQLMMWVVFVEKPSQTDLTLKKNRLLINILLGLMVFCFNSVRINYEIFDLAAR